MVVGFKRFKLGKSVDKKLGNERIKTENKRYSNKNLYQSEEKNCNKAGSFGQEVEEEIVGTTDGKVEELRWLTRTIVLARKALSENSIVANVLET